MGSTGSQDGNRHGDDAHHVQGDDAVGASFQLEAEEMIDEFIFAGFI